MDELEDTIDKVLAPERAIRWLVRIIILIVVIGASAIVLRVVWHMTMKVDKAVDEVEAEAEAETLTQSWFVLKKDAVDAATLEVKAARYALGRHQEEVATRSGAFSVSHKSDRDESARLNNAITTAQSRRLVLIREYNEKAVSATTQVIASLPKHIDVAEVPQPGAD